MATGIAPMTFREQLRKILFDKDISLVDLARTSGVAYQTLKGYTAKTTERKPSVPHLLAICKALGVTMDTFAECDDFQLKKREEDESSDKA